MLFRDPAFRKLLAERAPVARLDHAAGRPFVRRPIAAVAFGRFRNQFQLARLVKLLAQIRHFVIQRADLGDLFFACPVDRRDEFHIDIRPGFLKDRGQLIAFGVKLLADLILLLHRFTPLKRAMLRWYSRYARTASFAFSSFGRAASSIVFRSDAAFARSSAMDAIRVVLAAENVRPAFARRSFSSSRRSRNIAITSFNALACSASGRSFQTALLPTVAGFMPH